MKTNSIILDVPYTGQSTRSANCGPCSVKMICDYFNIKKPDGRPYSLMSLNRLLRTDKDYGIEEKDVMAFFGRVNFPVIKITPDNIITSLQRKHPILACFRDELHDGHYGVIIGASEIDSHDPFLIFHDPWPEFGSNFPRKMSLFREQVKPFGDWLIVPSLSPLSPNQSSF